MTSKNKVRKLREELGITQAELARLTGVSRQAINAIETGKYDPSIWLAYSLSKVFHRTIEEKYSYLKKVKKMVKRNNLRKIYMIYTITISELFALAIIFCAGNLFNGLPLEIIWILGIIAVICIPVVMYLFYRWRRKG